MGPGFQVCLFAYAGLKSAYDPPKTMISHQIDYVRGWCYPHPTEDAILVAPGAKDAPWVEGELQIISSSELPRIDKEEYGAKYDRTMVRTRSGKLAYVYEWQGKVPKNAQPITVFHENKSE